MIVLSYFEIYLVAAIVFLFCILIVKLEREKVIDEIGENIEELRMELIDILEDKEANGEQK